MDQEMETIRTQLIQEALSLSERVVEFWRSFGDPEPEKGYPQEFLKEVAQKLAQKPVDAFWLRHHIRGIWYVVSDTYLSKTLLGEDLCSFGERVEEFAERLLGAKSGTEAK